MKNDHIDKIKKVLSWIIFLSFFGIIFTSLIPWISVSETYPVEEDLFFNLDMMKKSTNEKMITLSEIVEQISFFFLLLFCFCILSYTGLILYRSNKATSISQIIILIGGCAFVVLSVLIVTYNYNFIKNVQDIEDTSLPEILGPVKFAYLPLIIGILSLIFSIIFTWMIITFSVQFFRGKTRKNKKSKDEQINKKTSGTEAPLLLDEPSKKEKPNGAQTKDHKDIENWLKDEVENIDSDKKMFDQNVINIPIDKEEKMKNDKDDPKPKEKIDKKPLTENEEITEELQIQDEIEKYPYVEPGIKQEDTFNDELEKSEIQNGTEPDLEEKEPLKQIDDTDFQDKIDGKSLVENEYTTEEETKNEEGTKVDIEKNENKKSVSSPFKSKEKTEETVIPDDLGTPISFDNVLSSVIDKKQVERTKKSKEEELEEDEIEEELGEEETIIEEGEEDIDEGKVIITVRCPECKRVFKVEKAGEITEIKCPKCGKEGIVK